MLYALLLFALIERLFLERQRPSVWSLAALGLGLCRVEGLVWGIGLLVLAALTRWRDRPLRIQALSAAGMVALAVLAQRLICWGCCGAGDLAVLIVAIAAVGYLPAENIHLVSAETRAKFSVRWSNMLTRSERETWDRWDQRMHRQIAIGQALNERFERTDSLVYAAIGTVGYYSEMNIYDQFGLINRHSGGHGHPPGHQHFQKRAEFYDDKPTLMAAFMYEEQGSLLKKMLRRQTRQWARLGVSEHYAPRLHPLEDGTHLLLLQYFDGDDETEWAQWEGAVEAL